MPTDILRLSEAVVALRRSVGAGPAPAPAVSSAPGEDTPFLLVVGADEAVGDGLRGEARARGQRLQVVAGVGEPREVLGARRRDVVILDTPAGDGSDEAFDLLRRLGGRVPPVPVVVVTRAETFTDRVEVAVGEVLERARAMEATVLTVDDDPAVLAVLQGLLAPDGRRVVTVTDPLRFWEVLGGDDA